MISTKQLILVLPNVNKILAKDWIDPQMVKTEQQMQRLQHTVNNAKRSVRTIRPRPKTKQITAPRHACGYFVSSRSVNKVLIVSTLGMHSFSKNALVVMG